MILQLYSVNSYDHILLKSNNFLVTLTLYNFIIINNSVDKLIKIKSQYMIIGIVIFMLSTAIIQIGFTYFFGDFSLTWLPPALSISEIDL